MKGEKIVWTRYPEWLENRIAEKRELRKTRVDRERIYKAGFERREAALKERSNNGEASEIPF